MPNSVLWLIDILLVPYLGLSVLTLKSTVMEGLETSDPFIGWDNLQPPEFESGIDSLDFSDRNDINLTEWFVASSAAASQDENEK